MNYNDVYKSMLLNRGGSVNNSDVKNSKNSINRKFKNDPSYKLAKLKKRDITIEETDLDTRIVNIDTDTKKKKLYLRPDTNVEVGDYIKYPNKTYLVLEVEDNLISPYAESKECNKNIKWMYKNVLHKTDSILTNQTKYTLGTDVISVGLTEGDSRFQIITSYNENTQTILEGQRMIFNNKAWKVTQVDFVSDVGLLNILFGQTAINNEIDDMQLEIAGAWEIKHTYTWNLPTSTIEITQNSDYTLNYSIVDETGKDIDYGLLTVKSSDGTLVNVIKNGKDITIKGLNIGIGTITLDLPVGAVVEEKIINFEVKSVVVPKTEYQVLTPSNGTLLKLMSSSTFAFKKLNNGVEDTSLVIDWSLDSNGKSLLSQKKISVTKVTDRSYLVKNTNTQTTASFVIIFSDSVTNEVISSVNITLKGV